MHLCRWAIRVAARPSASVDVNRVIRCYNQEVIDAEWLITAARMIAQGAVLRQPVMLLLVLFLYDCLHLDMEFVDCFHVLEVLIRDDT